MHGMRHHSEACLLTQRHSDELALLRLLSRGVPRKQQQADFADGAM